MANTERRTLYLTEEEDEALQIAASRLGLSENAVIKIMLRSGLGLSLPTNYRNSTLGATLQNSPVQYR